MASMASRVGGVALISKALAELRPGDVQRLGEDAGLSGDGHEVGVAAPAWERVQVDVLRDAGAGCLAQIQAEVETIGVIDAAEGGLGLLGGEHHLLGCVRGQGGQRVNVKVWDDQQMAGRVGIRVEADEAVHPAVDDVGGLLGDLRLHAVRDSVVGGGDYVAEDAVPILGCRPVGESGGDAGAGLGVRPGDVAVAPGGPESIHRKIDRSSKDKDKAKDDRIDKAEYSGRQQSTLFRGTPMTWRLKC